MLFDWWKPTYAPWLLPLVLLAVPVLAAVMHIGLRRTPMRYEVPIDHDRKRNMVLNLLFGTVLFLAVAAALWRPESIGLFIAPIAMPCLLHFSGRLGSWRLVISQPERATAININLGSFIVLTAGVVLWLGAIDRAVTFPTEMESHGDAITRLGGMTLLVGWSSFFCGIGVNLRTNWREIQAQRNSASI
jgi:hypothetical protein